MSDQFVLLLPALLALVLLAFFAVPMRAGPISLAPNVAWEMSLVMAAFYPSAWPRWFAFALGLLQDVVFGTPLGSQALLTLLLVQLTDAQARRQAHLNFQVRWLEAAGTLVVWHVLLWALLHFVMPDATPLRAMLRMGLVNALWYPVFYAVFTRLILLLPPLK